MKKLIIMLLVTFSVVGAGAWVIETVDDGGGVGRGNSMALDSSGRPHISYYDGSNGYLKYARWDGSAWQIETVDSSMNSVRDTSLVLDSTGNPHIAYHALISDYTNYLKYARWDGATWQIETLNAPDFDRYSSLALDSTNKPHITYLAGRNNYQLMYTHWNGTDWLYETIDSAGYGPDRFSKPSLALDSADKPHISFFDTYDDYGLIKYTHWNGSTWQIETLSTDYVYVVFTALALNILDNPSILGNNLGYMNYFYMDSSGWQYEFVGFAGPGTPSLAFDSSDNPHLSYYCHSDEILKYAVRDGSSWQLETVDSTENVG